MVLMRYKQLFRRTQSAPWTLANVNAIETLPNLVDPILQKWNRMGSAGSVHTTLQWRYELIEAKKMLFSAPESVNIRQVLTIHDA